MPTSSEFVTLCQSQVALLTQGLGAALSIVYLTEELTTAADTQLMPIVAHPEAALNWGEEQILTFLTQIGRKTPRLLAQPSDSASLSADDLSADDRQKGPQRGGASGGVDAIPFLDPDAALTAASALEPIEVLLPQQQMVLPLIYQEQVMGLLVTARADRAWNEAEQQQIEQVAQTLTAARILDWRAEWLSQDLQQQQLLEDRRSDLLDDLLHQFRNPLTALRTFGKLLIKRLRPEDVNRSVAESIVRESDRLQDLLKQIDAAIDLAPPDLAVLSESEQAVDAGNGPIALPSAETRLLLGGAIHLQPDMITAVLHPLLDSATAIAQDRQLMLDTEIAEFLPPVQMDRRALREVVSNLLDNALKYTPAGGHIYVAVQPDLKSPRLPLPDHTRSGRYQCLIVADTGPGIPPQDLQHLFERHYRGVQSASSIPGTGLGLAIARELVQQMQGQIQIFSPAVTSGLLPANWPSDRGTAAVVWLMAADPASVVVSPL